mgnify:FL=1
MSTDYEAYAKDYNEFQNPRHYTDNFGIEPIDFIKANEMDFLEGNIIKYVSRYPHKGGVKDLKKAQVYLNWLIEREEANE